MILQEPTHDSVFAVVRDMRLIDQHEIYGLRNHSNPYIITSEVMAWPAMTWVACDNGNRPIAVIGGIEVWPHVWRMHCFGTERFAELALPLTRFVKRNLLPTLWRLGAQRIEAHSIADHVEAHKWLESFGAAKEGVFRKYGRYGDDYFCFAIVADVAYAG